jgi:hypothetical protein
MTISARPIARSTRATKFVAPLKEASCRSCEAITGKIELYIARNIFHELRSRVRAPSRKKALPSTLSVNVSVGDQEITHEFMAADQPFSLKLPIWDLHGIMRRGSDPGEPPRPHPGQVRHAIEIATAVGGIGGLRLLVAVVRLFAHSGTAEHGMPIDRVVAGAPRWTGEAYWSGHTESPIKGSGRKR